MESAALLLLLVIPGTLAGPLDWRRDYNRQSSSSECASRCTGTSKFQYDVGKTYQYKYEVATTTNMNGAGEGAARMDVQATASIHILSKCELALTLSDVVVKTSEPGSSKLQMVEDWEYKSAMERNPLRFSFQDGRVEDLCPSEEETLTSLNFKRGVLSAFQNSMNQHDSEESLQEVDVTGSCPTTYSLAQKGWKSQHFEKSKQLLGCTERNNYKTFMRSTPFKMPNTIQSLPLLKGHHKCRQSVSTEGHLISTSCIEALVFRPFSKKDAGAATETKQKLQHMQTLPGTDVRKGPVSRTTSLLFEHEKKLSGDEESLYTARQKLSELCRVTMETIPASAPGLFTDMVYLMRGLNSQQIMDIYERLHRNNICGDNKERGMKFFLDAIPMIGTSSSVEVLVELLLGGQVTGAEAEAWIISFNFIHDPSLEMITQGKRLLLSNTWRKSSMLPVTSIINNYCRSHSCHQREIDDVVTVLSDILGKKCDASDEDLVLLALRAARNMGNSRELSTILTSCMEASDNSMFIRVFAAEAFKSVPCDADRKPVMDTFMNKGEDAELRIAAYLSLMQCPNEVTLSEVKKALENESVNQVGSFVWTHLTNLLQTSSPQKQDIRDILEDEKLKTEFNMDRRKYSRNYEYSFFSEKFGTGAMAESNVIFSSSSFIPRSVMLNLTVDVLGQSVNLLEVGGRVQGLEVLLQKYLSNSGIFGKADKEKGTSPSRCVKPQKMDKMKEKFAASKDDMSASFYVRMFGNELGFEHLNEKQLLNIKDRFSLDSILSTLAKGDDISFTKSAMFLDSTVAVPTIGGMSLRLSVNGSATIELVANGKIDMRRLSRKRMQANFNFKPSSAVKLSGLMSLDSGVATSGLRMTTTLHTSTATSGSIDLTNGQLLSVDFDTPLKQMDLLDVKSEFFIVHNEVEQKQEMPQNSRVSKRTCSSANLLKVAGYELCGEVSYMTAATPETSPYFPFTGPMSMTLTMDKKDAPRGFKLVGKQIQNDETSVFHLSIDTPGSDTDRAVSLGYYVDRRANTLEAELVSPWKKMIVKGSFTSDELSHIFSAILRDDGREYKLLTQVDGKTEGDVTTWTPTIVMSRPQDSKVLAKTPVQLNIDGFIKADKKYKDVSADITVKSGLSPDPIQIKGNLINKDRQKTLYGSVSLGPDKVYSGTVQMAIAVTGSKQITNVRFEPTVLISTPSKQRLFLLSGDVDYKKEKLLKGNLQVNMDEVMSEPAVLSFKITQAGKKDLLRYKGTGKLTSSFASIKTKGFINTLETGTKVTKGPILTGKITLDYRIDGLKNRKLRKNVVVFSSKIYDRSTSDVQKYDFNLNVDSKRVPEASFISNVELSHKTGFSKAMLTMRQGSSLKALKDKSNEISIGTTVYHQVDDETADIRYDVQLIYPEQDIEYQIEGKHSHNLGEQFELENYANIIYAKRKNIEFRLQGSNDGTDNKLNAKGSLEFRYPSFELKGKNVKGRSFKVSTAVERKPDEEYVHSIKLQLDNKEKHSMETRFKKTKTSYFDLSSKVQIDGDHPTKLTIELNRNEKLLKGGLDVLYKDTEYEFDISSEKLGELYYLNSWNFLTPERRVKGSLEGVKEKDGEYFLKLSQAWDADNHPSKKIDMAVTYTGIQDTKHYKADFNFILTTPFEGYEIFQYKDMSEMQDNKFMKQEVKIIWASRDNELSYATWFLLPVSAERLEMTLQIVTPMETLRKFNLEVSHKMEDTKYLSTKVKTVYNKDDVTVNILFSDKGSKKKEKLDMALTLSSTSLPQIRNVALTFKHMDNDKKHKTQGAYTRNGEQYAAIWSSQYQKVDTNWLIHSDVEVNLPEERPFIINFKLTPSKSGKDQLFNFSLALDWKTEYNFDIKAGYKHDEDFSRSDQYLDMKLPIEDYRRIEYQAHHENKGDVKEGSFYLRMNENPDKTHTSKYTFSKTETNIELINSGATFTLKALYGKFPYTLYLQTKWPEDKERNELLFEASVDENSHSGWSTSAKLVTPFEDAKNVNIKGDVKKVGETDWSFAAEISMGVREKITVNANVDTAKMQKMSAEIKTPYKQMTSFVFGHNNEEQDGSFSSVSHLEIQPVLNKVQLEQTLKYKPDVSARYMLTLPDTDFKFIEINLEHQEKRRGVKTHVNVKYHPSKEIDVQLKSKYNKKTFPDNTKVSLDLSTPFEVLPSLNFKVDIGKKENKWIGSIDLKSAAKELEYFNVNMQQEHSETKCYTDFSVQSSVFETVTAGVHLDMGELAGLNVTLDAPSVGRSMLGFKKKSKSWTDFQNKVFMEINGHDLDLDIGLKHVEKETNAWVTYVYPGAQNGFIKTSVHRIGNSPFDFDVGGFMKVGRNSKPYNVSMQFSYIKNKYALGTTFESPYTKSLSYLFSGESHENGGHETKIYAKYGRKFLLDTMSMVKIQDESVMYKVDTTYKYNKTSHRSGSTIKADWTKEGEEVTVEGHANDAWVKAEFSHKKAESNHGKETVDLQVTTPYEGYKDIGISSAVIVQPDHVNGKSTLEYTDGEEVVLAFDYSKPSDAKITISTDLTLPIEGQTRQAVFNLDYTKPSDSKVTINTDLTLPIEGQNKKSILNFDLSKPSDEQVTINADITLPIEGQTKAIFNLDYTKRSDEKVTVNADLTLPIQGQTKQAVFNLDFTKPTDTKVSISADLSLPIKGYSKKSVLNFDYSKPNNAKLFINADLSVPVKGYGKNTFVYSQVLRKNKFVASTEFVTGKNDKMSGRLEVNNDEDFEVTIKGPVKEFESVSISGKLDKQQLKVEGEMDLKLSLNSRPINVVFNTHINNEPLSVAVKVRSPYEIVRSAEFDLKHWGREWKQFRTSVSLKSNKVGSVSSDTTWRFTSIKDMEGSTALTSDIEHVRNAKLAFSTKGPVDDKISHVEVSWDDDKEIVSDMEWSFSDNPWRKEVKAKIDLSTSFDVVKQAGLDVSHVAGTKNFQNTIKIQHNGITQLDTEVSYKNDGEHQANVEMRRPRPMSIGATATVDTGLFDGKLRFDWDKRNPEGHIEVETKYEDKSGLSNVDKFFKFKLFNPARVVGTDCSYKQSDKEVLSAGTVTWDEQKGKTFSYDIGWNDRSSAYTKMHEGHMKLGVPKRSVKVQTSFSDSGASQAVSSAVFWDADKDETKKVTLSTSVETIGNTKRVGLNVNLPHINKQLNLGVSNKGGYGSSLIDTKAELSYSSDPRKMITITSKIDNAQYLSDKSYNYTLDFGLAHPVTGLDMQLSSHMGSVDNICSTGTKLSFVSAHKETKTLDFRAQFDKSKRNMEIEVLTPLKDIRMEGQLKDKRGRHNALWKTFEDGKQTLRFEVEIDPKRKNMDIEFNYDQDDRNKMVQLIGRYVNDSALKVDLLSYEARGRQRQESMLAVRLNSSHVLHTRITWRPTLLDELQKYLSNKMTVMQYAASGVFDEAVNSIGAEVKAKYVLMSKEMNSELQQVFSLMDKEMDSLNNQLQALSTVIRRAYLRNDLHIKEMGEQAQATFKEIVSEMNNVVMNYKSYHLKATQATQDWLSDLSSYPVAQRYLATINRLVQNLKDLRGAVEEVLDKAAKGVEKVSKTSYKHYMALSREVDRKLNSYQKALNEIPLYKKLVSQQAELAKMGIDKIINPSHMYSELYLKAQSILEDQFHDMMVRPEFQQAHALASEVHAQYQYWNANKTVANAANRLFDLSRNVALMQLKQLKEMLVDLQKSKVIVYDPQRGELQVEIHLPIALKSLAEPPKISPKKLLNKLDFWSEMDLPSTEADLLDMYQGYMPSLEPSEWVPPFTGSAYLMGSQHYLTFDNHHYDFLSSCSHVLARDMLNDTFSIVVNYDRRPTRNGVKSLCFNVENSVNFEISRDYKLTVNNRDAEMPYITDKVHILREGDVVRVRYIGGFETLINPRLDIYKVSVSGWYHGRLAGMMGPYDNEPGNDMMTSRTWDDLEVNRKSCSSNNVALSPGKDVDQLCHKYFHESSSKYRTCFKQVDPTMFLDMCQTYMGKMSPEEAVRQATDQYRYVCQDHGIYMGPLKEYSTCGIKEEFEVDRRDAMYQSADVVFVVEDSKCNKWAQSSLSKMATEINKALENAGMKDNRFGLEGYGASDSAEPTARTINGQMFAQVSLFLKAVETLKLEKSSHESSIYQAMQMAMKYPFRAGVAKVLVLAPCTSCEISLLESQLGYRLRSNAFSVHILQEQGFSLDMAGSNRPNNYRIYGLDNSKTFTNHISDSGVTPLAVQREKSEDYCNIIAEMTSGSVFDTAHLQGKSSIREEFIQSFAHRVGWDTKLPECQRCSCNSYSGNVECKLCEAGHVLTNSPLEVLNLPNAIGRLHDMNHEVKTYLGLLK